MSNFKGFKIDISDMTKNLYVESGARKGSIKYNGKIVK